MSRVVEEFCKLDRYQYSLSTPRSPAAKSLPDHPSSTPDVPLFLHSTILSLQQKRLRLCLPPLLLKHSRQRSPLLVGHTPSGSATQQQIRIMSAAKRAKVDVETKVRRRLTTKRTSRARPSDSLSASFDGLFSLSLSEGMGGSCR